MTNDHSTPAPSGFADPARDAGDGPDTVRDVVRDALVVGGGAAGLSAGLTLARARRDVVVVDAGEPRNAPAAGVHGYLTRDGIAPAELTSLGRTEVESYGGEVRAGTVTALDRVEPAPGVAARFRATVTHAGGGVETVLARRVVATTGVSDQLPPVAGLAERWGRDAVHCPYCHGWEVRDRLIGVLGGGPLSVHQALLFRQWSDRVVLFLNDAVEPTDDEWEQLAARGVGVVTGAVTRVLVTDDRMSGVELASGRTRPVEALALGAALRVNSDLLTGLGVEHEPHPLGVGLVVPSDPATGATSVPGLWLAGNVADPMMQVVAAAASGVRAAALANADLVAEDIALAVAARRAPFSAAAESAGTARLLGDRRHGVEPRPADAEAPASAHPEQEVFDRAYWEDRYGAEGFTWSGEPNAQLVAETVDLTPGRALDVGSGEGGDAIWLARRGWTVTGTDIAEAALAKAARRAEATDPAAAARITWEQHDVTAWAPEPGAFDLVSAQFMHLADPERAVLFRALAAAVAPGGTLLVVGHDLTDDPERMAHRRDLMFTVDDVLAAIDGEGLEVEVAGSRERAATSAHHGGGPMRDVVVRAHRAS
jgi:thioredoxin reductase/SAM-dependent methyltransferase